MRAFRDIRQCFMLWPTGSTGSGRTSSHKKYGTPPQMDFPGKGIPVFFVSIYLFLSIANNSI